MRRRAGWRRFAIVVGAWVAIWGAGEPAHAQGVPTGFQEYFVLGYEQHVWDLMAKVEAGQGGGAFADGMNSLVTATASAVNQVVYYDHWEDGFEADIFNPAQASTMIIGDGNPANGDACDFNSSPCGVDTLSEGDFVNFGSNQGLGASCSVPSVQPLTLTELCSSVPVNPRCAVAGSCTASEVRFDGGDLVVSSGGPISIVHSQDPLTQFIGGSTEMLSRQAVAAARSYSVPVGEDLYVADTATEPFHYVDLNLVAFDDGTQIFVDSPGAGTVSLTLNRGQHWSSLGFIDDGPFIASQFLVINAGTRVSTTGPISGLLFTGGDGTWATRHYALLPDILHSTDYVITAPGDDPAGGPSAPTDRPMDIYIFNPDPLNSIDVTTTDTIGSSVVTVPANSVVDYFAGTGRFVPNGSTVRLTSDRRFWGISGYDYNTNISDWGHSWLATRFLTQNYTVSFAPGNLDPTVNLVNLNGVFVAATQDNTQVQIDFDGDGVFDAVDTDGDGLVNAAPLPNNTYVVNSLASLRVFDPNDFDNTGTRIFANKPVAVAWGQDTDLTGFGDVALDTGYTVYPTNQLFLDPVLLLDKAVDTSVVPTAGGVATYTLTLSTFDFGPLTSLQIFDLLPPGVVGADYVPGSTLITYPDLSQDTTDPVASIDPSTGRDRLDWTLSPSSLDPNRSLTVRYSVNLPATPGGLPRLLTNEARAQGNLGASIFSPVDTADVTQADIFLTKAVDNLAPEAGDVLTYTVAVTNNGLAETGVIVTDPIPANTTFCGALTAPPGACSDPTAPVGPFDSAGSYDAGQNAVVWTAANLPPGGPHLLTFQVRVDPGAPAGTQIVNSASYESLGTPLFPSNEVTSVVVGPNLEVSKIGPSLLHPNEVASFDIMVRNTGAGSASDVLITDFFPSNATYVVESMEWRLNVAPFTPVTDAADADEGTAFVDRLELRVPSLGPGEDITFRFFVRVDMGTVGLFVNNQATVSANESPPQDTNLVQVPIVGSSDVTGHVFLDLDGNGVQDVGEPDLANVDVCVNSIPPTRYTCLPNVAIPDDAYDGSLGSMACCTITVPPGDFGPTPATTDVDVEVTVGGHTFVGDLTIKVQSPTSDLLAVLNRPGSAVADDGSGGGGDSSDWTGDLLTFDDDGGDPSAETLGSTIGAGTSVCSGDGICAYTPAPDTAGGLTDLAGFDGADPRGDWTVCVGDGAGGDTGTFVGASVVLTTTDSPTVTQKVVTDANGDWTATVNGTTANADVDETDPDFPPGAQLTTANDPQGVTTVTGGTVATAPVGYQPLPIAFTKTSDAIANEVFEGDTITYTIEAVNTTAVTQTGVDLSDALPAGTSYVPASTQVAQQVFRVNEYFIVATDFTGATFDLTLNQDLAANYLAIVQGSDGNGASNGDRGPDENYAALTADPFGTGELGVSSGSDVITLSRGNSVNGWQGVVTVVECLADCAVSGFVLRDVRRVDHAGTSTSGAEATTNPWVDINQTMLLGGFNGAGCDTTQATAANTKVCHARIFPSNPDQINWTRDAGGATLSAATSTVMVAEWGTDWNVQRVRVQGGNGGGGADAVGEYNTAAIGAVTRANTWVWGTGHTNDQGIGDAGEGVLVTLGDGVNQNVSETSVAAGLEVAGNAVDFEVYALTHSDLATDYVFKADGDSGALTVDVATAAAGQQRMALITNGQNGTGNAFPRPMFSARYTAATTIRMERRRTGQNFPAWIQGVDFSAISATVSGGAPPGLVVPGDGITSPPGETLRVTFQVIVDDPLAPGITQIVNNATFTTDQQGPFNAGVTDDVIRLGVTVEPNNGNFVVFDAVSDQTRTYSHVVTNAGVADDSYGITAFSELGALNPTDGWVVELIDPSTGAVIATDTDFNDSTWDGGMTVNTGTLMSGESIAYDIRVTVPAGTPEGAQETTTLTATSDRNNSVRAFATDETTVVDMAGPVVLVSDQSGVVAAGGSIAYSHRVFNNTGVADTLDLTAFPSEPGWASTIYNDSNGDGVYTPGIDVAIMNTLLLPDGGSQLIFVVVDAPGGATAGDTDVTSVTAISRNDPDLFDAVSDTTTVSVASTHDLSGGDTLLVDAGDDCTGGNDCPVFPGTLKSLGSSDDRFDFTITASPFFGLDGLPHPTQLLVDTDGNGIPDLQIAEDSDGDGDWDSIAPGFDTNGDLNPDVLLSAGGELAYELRRPVDPLQGASRDPVTLSATSQATGEVDSVTAVNLLAAATHAMLARFEGRWVGGQVVIEWDTSLEHKTAGFVLRRQPVVSQSAGRVADLKPLHAGVLPALRNAPIGGSYRFVDTSAVRGGRFVYVLYEVEINGRERLLGRLGAVADPRKLAPGDSLPAGGFERQARVPVTARSPVAAEPAPLPTPKADGPVGRLKLLVQENDLYFVSAQGIADAFGAPPATVESLIASGSLRLHRGAGTEAVVEPCSGSDPGPGGIFADGFESGDLCAWRRALGAQNGEVVGWLPAPDGAGIYFYGEGLDSIYTDDNVYWLEPGAASRPAAVDGGSPTAVTGQAFSERLNFEEEGPFPLTSVIEDPDSDFWFWDFVNVNPDLGIAIDTMTVTVDTPQPTADAVDASMSVFLQAESRDDEIELDHQVEIRLNGAVIGTSAWDGSTAHRVDMTFAQSLLVDGSNTVEIHAPAASGIASEIFYLDAIEISYRRSYRAVSDRLVASAGGHPTITLEGFSRPDIAVIDITEPLAPRRVTDLGVEDIGGEFSFSLQPATSTSRYIALPLADAAVPTLVVDQRSDLLEPSHRAEYLVIAAAGLENAAEQLAEARRDRFEAKMVRLEDVYDELSQGIVTPWAIRDFLATARQTWAVPPRYVVLAGDSSFDFKDRLGFGGNLLPAPMTSTPEGLFPSDHRTADLDGDDGVPEVAIGRLPARTDAELAAYVAKLQAYEAETGAWTQQTTWVADGVDEGGEFSGDSDALIEQLAPGYDVDRIYVDELGPAPARQGLLDAFADGTRLIHFLGHGNLMQMGDNAGLLRAGDVPALLNGPRQPVLVAMTCALGRFDRIFFDTLSESLVLHDQGGAIALWSPTGFSFNQEALVLAEGFLPELLDDPDGSQALLGDAVTASLAHYLSTAEEPRGFIPFIYTLLGDPAIQVRP
ncbi:MAG: C25 family cysteine peptidase [Acidobacteriota bacterium]